MSRIVFYSGWESLADGKMSRAPRVHMTPARRDAENSRCVDGAMRGMSSLKSPLHVVSML